MAFNKLAMLEQLKEGKITLEQYITAEAEAEAGDISLETSRKGNLVVRGLGGRFPLTLFKGKAEVLFSEPVVKMVREYLATDPLVYHEPGEYTDSDGTKIKTGHVVVRLSTGKHDKAYIVHTAEDALAWHKEQSKPKPAKSA